jgi:hypothetical protein
MSPAATSLRWPLWRILEDVEQHAGVPQAVLGNREGLGLTCGISTNDAKGRGGCTERVVRDPLDPRQLVPRNRVAPIGNAGSGQTDRPKIVVPSLELVPS